MLVREDSAKIGRRHGVVTVLRDDLSDFYNVAVRTVDWDKEGRVAMVRLQSKTDPKAKVVIYNILSVAGSGLPYRDPESGVKRDTKHDRKHEFQNLLMRECKRHEAERWNVLLAGNMHVVLDELDTKTRSGGMPFEHIVASKKFNKKMLTGGDEKHGGFKGVDIWRKMNERQKQYTFIPRVGGTQRQSDFFLAGSQAWEKGCVKDWNFG
ncbi:DNase I protein [Pyrenophora tritici-repentis]|nr:DNase I protein [Pyrenophora tritici-repentis]